MCWDDFTRDEKRAVLKSAAYIANADGHINYSEDQYFTMLVMMMKGDATLVKDAMDMWKMNMTHTIRNMSQAKKDMVRNVWLKMMNRRGGGTMFGRTVVSSSTDEGKTIISMADSCGIDVSDEYDIDNSIF
jgi:hypothetical protein